MFQLGRELRRLFKLESLAGPSRDGLAGGEPGLLELLNLDMLKAEAKMSDIAAGRISARDRPMLQLRQATVWRELARRTGDQDALRRAAAAAESALRGLDRRGRPEAFARARVEQAACAMLGAELSGDLGLAAAADAALAEAAEAAPRTSIAAYGRILRAQIAGAQALSSGDPALAMTAANEAAVDIAALEREQRDRSGRRLAALGRLARAEILAACGAQMRDTRVLESALTEAVRAALSLDPAYEPVSWSRASILRGEILTALGEMSGDAAPLDRAVPVLASVFDHLLRDHSPLDWALGQHKLGRALSGLAETTSRPDLLEQARSAFDRALVAIGREHVHPLRAAAAQAKGAALTRQAEMLGDRLALDAAEAAFRCELAAADPRTDPVAWAVCQVSLAQVYLSRLAMTGRDKGERAKAALALDAALEVFSERGLRNLSAVAASGLERLRATA